MAIKVKKKKNKSDEEPELAGVEGEETPLDEGPSPLDDLDQFMHTGQESVSWAAANPLMVVGALALVLTAVGGAIWFNAQTDKQAIETSDALTKAIDVLEIPLAPPVDIPDLKKDDEGPTFKTATEKYTSLETQAKAVVDAHGSAPIAGPAKLMLARAKVGTGKPAEAIPLYKEWLAANPKGAERPVVLQALANAQAGAKKYDEAITSLEELKKADDETFGESAAYQIARLQEKAGKKDKAKTSYETFIKTYPESEKLEYVKMYRDLLM